jgi:uncharacterized protein (DUF1684 family)
MLTRPLLACLVTLLLFSIANGQTFYGTTDLAEFRKGRDAEFCNKDESPLKPEDFASFKGLNYFPVSKAYRVNATFTRTADEKYFDMPTSSGKTKKFVKYGVVTFAIKGKPHRLNVYQIDEAVRMQFPEYGDLLFIPFKDITYRTETYGGGRYIDIKMPKGKKLVLDFNLAYNPNCAYGGDKYSCPIPPRENTLNIAINAGEKKYPYTGHDAH